MASQRIKGITIELGGDTTKLVTALANVDKAISSTQTNIKDLDRALKLDPGNVALLKDKQQELGTEIDNTKSKIETEKKALEQMKNTEGFDANSKAAKDLQIQIDLDEAALKQLQKEAKEFGSVGKQHFNAIGEKVKEVGDKIKSVGDSMSAFGKKMTAKVSTPIIGALGSAVKVTADFDSQMSKVQAISGATGEEFNQLREKAREMGANTKYSATEAGEAFEYMGMAGWKTEQMLEGIPAILNLAAASGEELGTTSDIVTDALTAFGLKAEDAGRFADILASAATNANTNVSMMGESFKYVAPVAGAMGYSAEDVAVALGLMANSGIKADMAGTSLRNMMQRMAKPTKESYNAMVQLGLSIADSEGNAYSFREIMDQIRESMSGITVDLDEYNSSLDALDEMLASGEISQEKYDEMLNQLNVDLLGTAGSEKARYAAMLGGTRAMAGLLAIANTTDEEYEKLTSAIDNSSESFARLKDGSVVPLTEALASGEEVMETYNGQAEAMAATMQDNLGGDLTVLKSMLEELAISLGDLLMPTIRAIVEKVQEVVTWLNSLDEGTKQTIITVALIVAAIGPVITVIGSLVSAIGTVISVIGTLIPILMGPIGIIALIVAAIVALGVVIYKNWDEIKEWGQNVAKKFVEVKDDVVKKVTELKDKAVAKWEEFKTNTKQKIDKIKSDVVGKFTEIKTNIVNKVTEAKTNAVNMFENMKKSITDKVTNIKENIIGGFQKAIDWIKDLPSQAWNWGADIINGIITGIQDKIGGIVDAVSGIADTIAEYLHFSEPDVGPLKDFHTFMPDMMKEMISGINRGIPALKATMNNMAGILVPQQEALKGGNNSTTNTVSINVYGAQGQNVNELASIIEDRLAQSIARRGAAF